MTDRQFVFPITTGRSGTVFLTELLRMNRPDAEVHHERLGFTRLGVDTPDASHFTFFNSVGNVPHVQAFWQRKLGRILENGKPAYAEISHFLVKAGLIENIAPLLDAGRVDLVVLTRDPAKILWSLTNRFEFANPGFTWLFYLDARYPNVILNSAPFAKHGAPGKALWYIHEMLARAAYYEQLAAEEPRLRIHRVDLSEITRQAGAARLLKALGWTNAAQTVRMPPRKNETKTWHFGEDMRRNCQRLAESARADHATLAAQYIASGRRLADGARAKG